MQYFINIWKSLTAKNAQNRSTELQDADLENEAQEDPKTKQSQLDNRIATLDNGTLVEVLKFLNYNQLANTSLISKRFCNLIQTHRHKLALLYVECHMRKHTIFPTVIKIFNKLLSTEEYNEWIVCNGYSKQVSLESQVVREQSAQYGGKIYVLWAHAVYKDSKQISTYVFSARGQLNHENWPVFQHFVRLLTDPFIYIHSMGLAYETDVLNLLTKIISPYRARLQCEQLTFTLKGDIQKFFTWIKQHVLCHEIRTFGYLRPTYDEEFLDFFTTGASCTSKIYVKHYYLSNVIVDFVQKFMDLKNSDEYQMVEFVESNAADDLLGLLKRNYAKFLVKEERNEDDSRTVHVFECVNNDIGKKLQLSITKLCLYAEPYFSLKIDNL
ncbi:hypothetical protein Ddc_20299 [Ditylenchus destructor]|nr:hypothetical protein Ddc_20299 [Ditylenchus destructor]